MGPDRASQPEVRGRLDAEGGLAWAPPRIAGREARPEPDYQMCCQRGRQKSRLAAGLPIPTFDLDQAAIPTSLPFA
jgi:hypothetical protein